MERTPSGVACNGDGCAETFDITESGTQTDPADFNCGDRCSTDGPK